VSKSEQEAEQSLAAAWDDTARPSEGDGWVNWSGLATLLASLEKAFAARLDRLFS
jgi:hypothetical protein